VRILQDGVDSPTPEVDIQKDILIQLTFWNFRKDARLYSAIHLMDQVGTYVLASSTHTSVSLTPDHWHDRPHPVGLFQSVCRIPANFLNEGTYSINAIVGTDVSHTAARADNVVSFRVYDTGTMRKEISGGWLGVVRPRLAWQTEYQGRLDSKLDSAQESKTIA
jgi:lipopolysaccharide transport system ATP-binding protein